MTINERERMTDDKYRKARTGLRLIWLDLAAVVCIGLWSKLLIVQSSCLSGAWPNTDLSSNTAILISDRLPLHDWAAISHGKYVNFHAGTHTATV